MRTVVQNGQPRTPRRQADRFAWRTFALACVVSLASCGGNDDGAPPTVTPVASNQPPTSASDSTDGFIAYLKTLVVTIPETTLPLDVTTFVAPTSESALPDTTI